MTSDEIFDKVMEEPFRPFRIRLKDGRTFDVLRDHSVAWTKDGISLKPHRIAIPGAIGPRYLVLREDLESFEPIAKEAPAQSA